MGMMNKIGDNAHYASLLSALACLAISGYFLSQLIIEDDDSALWGTLIFGIGGIWAIRITIKEFKAAKKEKN